MRELLLNAIKEINKDLNIKELENIDDNTNLFELLDSMAVLDLILEIETQIENKYGRYVQIADESIMDALKSPFRRFDLLIKYVDARVSVPLRSYVRLK